MYNFKAYAENYGIGGQEFTLFLSGAELLSLVSLIQLSRATSDIGKFDTVFPELLPIALDLIERVSRIDKEAGEQLQSGWDLQNYSRNKKR